MKKILLFILSVIFFNLLIFLETNDHHFFLQKNNFFLSETLEKNESLQIEEEIEENFWQYFKNISSSFIFMHFASKGFFYLSSYFFKEMNDFWKKVSSFYFTLILLFFSLSFFLFFFRKKGFSFKKLFSFSFSFNLKTCFLLALFQIFVCMIIFFSSYIYIFLDALFKIFEIFFSDFQVELDYLRNKYSDALLGLKCTIREENELYKKLYSHYKVETILYKREIEDERDKILKYLRNEEKKNQIEITPEEKIILKICDKDDKKYDYV